MKKILLIIALVLSLAACKNRGGESKVPNLRDELTIGGLSDDKWTYFSFESGEVVGQSTFASEEEDAAWAARKDWDLAICGEYPTPIPKGTGKRRFEQRLSEKHLTSTSGFFCPQGSI